MKEKVQVCIPLAGPMQSVPAPFAMCLPTITAALAAVPNVGERRFNFDSHFPLDCNRSHLVLQALEWGADWTLWLDCDMSFPDSLVPTLFAAARESGRKIVSGIYFKKAPPFLPVAMVAVEGKRDKYLAVDPLSHPEALVEVDLIGMGCALIHTDVFRALPSPWFRYNVREESGWPEVSEDVYFCQSARAAGFEILAHTGLVCNHYITAPVGLDHWREGRKSVREFMEET